MSLFKGGMEGRPCNDKNRNAGRSLAVSRYAGSSRQQVAALLWQVGVRFLSSEIALYMIYKIKGEAPTRAR